MSDQFQFDVFLSYKSDDRPRVRQLAERLRAAGLRVWFDDWLIKPGHDIYLSIERGLASSHTLVLCMSPAAFGSDWVGLERSTVLFRDPTNDQRRFIPLLLIDCHIPDTLRRYRHVDYRDASPAAFAELLEACRPETEIPRAKRPEPDRKVEPETTPGPSEPPAVLKRKLSGHKNWVNTVAVSPDGKWVASGGDDNLVKVWDPQTGTCLKTLEGHVDKVRGVAITPDGACIVSGSNDHNICVWDVRSGTLLRKWQVFSGMLLKWLNIGDYVLSIAVLPDGRTILSAGAGKMTVRWWTLAGELLTEFHGHRDTIRSVAISKDGRYAASGSDDRTIKCWELAFGKCLATCHGHSGATNSVQFAPDGQHVISGSEDKTVRIWELKTGICVGTLEGHNSAIDSVALSPDGKLVASTGFTDHTIRLWNFKTGVSVDVLQMDASPTSVAFSPTGEHIVAGTAGNDIYVYRLKGSRDASAADGRR